MHRRALSKERTLEKDGAQVVSPKGKACVGSEEGVSGKASYDPHIPRNYLVERCVFPAQTGYHRREALYKL